MKPHRRAELPKLAMGRQTARAIVIVILFVAVAPRAWSASVSLEPVDQIVRVGETFVLEMVWDFSDDATIGGGVAVDIGNPDSVSLLEFEFTDNPVFDPQFDAVCFGVPTCGSDIDMVRGNFAGITGPVVAARLTFLALMPGDIAFNLGDSIYGSFIATTLPIQNPELLGAAVSIRPVPLPAPLGLLAAALVALGVTGKGSRP